MFLKKKSKTLIGLLFIFIVLYLLLFEKKSVGFLNEINNFQEWPVKNKIEFSSTKYSSSTINKLSEQEKLQFVETNTTTKNESIFACYKNPKNRKTLPEIQTEFVDRDRSIFFLETSCKFAEEGKVKLTVRQACSIESAILANPKLDVYLLVASPSRIQRKNDLNGKIIRALLSYENFKMNYVDIDKFLQGTPVESLYKSGLMEKSYVPMVHISDVLRFVTMWRYGAIYLDLDVIVIKSLRKLGPNFTGLENTDDVAAGVMGFTSYNPGHHWIESILKDINSDFRPDLWKYNANDAVRRFLNKLCNETIAANMTPEKCKGFQLYPQNTFYSVRWNNWFDFFNKNKTDEVFSSLTNSSATHMWNYLSSNASVIVGQNTAYDILAQSFCPKVYSFLAQNSKF